MNGKNADYWDRDIFEDEKFKSSDIEPLVVKTHQRYYAYNLVCKLSVLSSNDSSAAPV